MKKMHSFSEYRY